MLTIIHFSNISFNNFLYGLFMFCPSYAFLPYSLHRPEHKKTCLKLVSKFAVCTFVCMNQGKNPVQSVKLSFRNNCLNKISKSRKREKSWKDLCKVLSPILLIQHRIPSVYIISSVYLPNPFFKTLSDIYFRVTHSTILVFYFSYF